MINISNSVENIKEEFQKDYANIAYNFIEKKIKYFLNKLGNPVSFSIKNEAMKTYKEAKELKAKNPKSKKYDEILNNKPSNVDFKKSQKIIDNLYRLFKDNITTLKAIIIFKPRQLQRFSNAFYIKNKTEHFWFKYYIGKIFNWKSFSSNKKVRKKLYEFCESLKIGVCPYCNRNFISTLPESYSNSSIRPSLDHFYPKDKLPTMALCLWNLVPTCEYCNSKFKLASNPLEEDILNPYLEGFDEIIKFELKYKKDDILVFLNNIFKTYRYNPNENDFIIRFLFKNLNKNNIDERNVYKHSKGSIKNFRLKEIYNKHKKLAIQTAARTYLYQLPTYKNHLSSVLEQNNSNKVLSVNQVLLVNQIEFGEILDNRNDCNEPLSKLRRDIRDQITSNYDFTNYSPLNENG